MEPNIQYHDFPVKFTVRFHRPVDVEMGFQCVQINSSSSPPDSPQLSQNTQKTMTHYRETAGSLRTTCAEETEASEPGGGGGQCRRLEKAPSDYLSYSLSSKTPNMLTLNGQNKWKGKPSRDVCDRG